MSRVVVLQAFRRSQAAKLAGKYIVEAAPLQVGRKGGSEEGGARPSLTDGRMGWGTAQVALDEPVRQALLDRLDAPPRGLFKEVRGLNDHS